MSDRPAAETPSVDRAAPKDPSTVGLAVGLLFGLPLMIIGVHGALVDSRSTHPAELARWVIGAAVVHDALLVPLVLGVGKALHLLIRSDRWWRPLRWALFATGCAALVAWPFVRGYGRNPTVPSLLPRNYAEGLAAIVGVIAGLAVTWASVAGVRRMRLSQHRRPPP
ncbi:MAG TPA: hypothetical protein VGM93_12055 [Acidimicrobiales bacterium]